MSKSIRLVVLSVFALSSLSVSTLAQSGVVNSTKNPVQIAVLHWYNANVTTHTLETHIYRLRQKIEDNPAEAQLLVTEGGGYKLVAGGRSG